ncbi:MAG: IS21 family transposase, partial [Treponema sp.]|nr:IS21 family transposase [Treponema sp.]
MNEQNNNGSGMSLSQALELIKSREWKNYDIEKVNLAELQRLTGITRAKLRRLKKNGFVEKENGNKGKKANDT